MSWAEQMWDDAIATARRMHESITNPKTVDDWVQFIDLHWDKLDLDAKQSAVRVMRRQAEIAFMAKIKEEVSK